MRFNSVRLSFIGTLAALLALIAVASVLAAVGLLSAERRLEAIDRTWLPGIRLLAAIREAGAVVEPATPVSADPRPSVNKVAGSGVAIDDLLDQYRRLFDRQAAGDRLPSPEAVEAAALEGRRTLAGFSTKQAPAPSRPSASGTPPGRDTTLTSLIGGATSGAHSDAVAGERAQWHALAALMAFVAVAAVATAGLVMFMDRKLLRPLGAVSRALVRLAAGHGDGPVPERNRRGDIGALASAFTVFRDNASALADAEQRADRLAHHDRLTGLPNRTLFAAKLDTALGLCKADTTTCAVIQIDLDHFKPINDLHGHDTGDTLLRVIAARLRDVTGSDGMVARFDGDEFAIAMTARKGHRAAVRDAVALATHLMAAITETVEIEQARIAIGASVGIALYPADGGRAEDLLRAVDLATDRAKHDGRGTFRFFKARMDEDLRARTALEADVRTALRHDRIQPYYQPLVDLASNRIIGFEVLARWRHPVRGAVPPDTFIPVVERLGLLDQMTASILHRAFHDSREWEPDVTLAVNVSPSQFQNIGFAAQLALILRAERFDPRRLEVEVTETALVGDLQAARHTLEALQRLGTSVVLDDFGTGYSNLSHLREFRFDKIKIDSSFVRPMAHNAECQKIVDAVLGLAHNLGMPTVAEGIETVEVRHLLVGLGCEYGQGFWFSQAVPADIATAMLKRQTAASLREAG